MLSKYVVGSIVIIGMIVKWRPLKMARILKK